MVDEKDIKYENISEFYEDTDAIHLKFQINHVQNGDYSMRILYVMMKAEAYRMYGRIWDISTVCREKNLHISEKVQHQG